jgi:predicted acetyltransferase
MFKIDYVLDENVDVKLDTKLRLLFSTCFVSQEDEVFKRRRFYKEMPSHRWLIFDNNCKLVAHTALHEKLVKVNEQSILFGGVSEVCVLPKFRNKGLVKRMLREVDIFLKAKSIKISILFGKKEYYSSSGYKIVDNLFSNTFTDNPNDWTKIEDPLIKELEPNSWPQDNVYLEGLLF